MPTPSTYQKNGMPMAPSVLAPGLNANGQIPNIAFLFKIVAKTAAYSCVEAESGTIFTTEGATAAVTFTLPAPASTTSGTWFIFYNAEDINMTVASGTADLMIAFNDVEADSVAFSTTSEKVGNGVLCVCDGAKWLAMLFLGADSSTVTIATA